MADLKFSSQQLETYNEVMDEAKEEQFKKYGDEVRDRMLYKARKGHIEHKGDFNDLTLLELFEHALDELADLNNFFIAARDLAIKLEKKDPSKNKTI